MYSSIDYCRRALGVRRVEELFRLPLSTEIAGACVCHAAPHDDMLTFMPEPTAGDESLLSHTQAQVVVFGHSHLQFMRTADTGQLLVNPGSVGMPFDGDHRAAYALWDGERDFELRRVEYDWGKYAASVQKRMGKALGPGVDKLVQRIEQAAFV